MSSTCGGTHDLSCSSSLQQWWITTSESFSRLQQAGERNFCLSLVSLLIWGYSASSSITTFSLAHLLHCLDFLRHRSCCKSCCPSGSASTPSPVSPTRLMS